MGYGFDGDSDYNILKKTEFKILLKNYEKLLVGSNASHMKKYTRCNKVNHIHYAAYVHSIYAKDVDIDF